MNVRGLEMLLALLGCMLAFGLVTGNLTLMAVLWAFAGIAACMAITSGLMRIFFPYLEETRRWARFNERVGLTLHSRGGVQRPSLSGRVAECHVSISPVENEDLIVVSPSTASFETHQVTMRLRHDEDPPSLATGDREFDSKVFLSGSLPEVIAVLDADTRKEALALMSGLSVEVRRRHVVKYGRHLELDPNKTMSCIEAMARIADRLLRIPARRTQQKLADNAERDPNPKVRALNLQLLFEYYPPDARTLLLGRRALADDDLDCVLAGAIGLADAGSDADKELAFSHLSDIAVADTFPDSIRSAAIDALSLHFLERARSVLEEIAREKGPLPSALPSALVWLDLSPSFDDLISRALFADEETQLEIAKRVFDHGSHYEPLACGLLSSPFDRVQLAAIDGLRRLGTIRAVEPLLPLTHGLLRPKELREKAQLAVEMIQARAGHHDSGRLSLTDPARGELSFHGEAGALSYEE